MNTRVQSGSSYRVTELQIPTNDWMVLNELSREMPNDLASGHEAEALDWLENQGATYAYALSPTIHEAMSSVRDGTDSSVLLLTTEDPGDSVGPSPLDHLTPTENMLFQADKNRGILVGAFALHGYGYSSQQHGVIFNNMIVAESQRNVPLVASSVNELGFHTEDSAFAEGIKGGMSPDVLSLHYFRNKEGVTTPVSVPDFNRMDDRLISDLRAEKFFIPNSNAQGGAPNQTDHKISVLYGDSDRPSMRFNAALMPTVPEVQGDDAMLIIEAFTKHLKDQSTTLIMQPGDILFINNRQAVHAKGEQKWEAPAGQGRWQRRLALTKDLDRINPFTDQNSRIVNPDKYRSSLMVS